MSLTLNIKPSNKEVAELYKNSKAFHEGDAGFDLYCPNDIEIYAQNKATINFQISCELLEDCSVRYAHTYSDIENLDYKRYLLVPRSSITNTDLIMLNSPGIIDAGYRGEIKAKVWNYAQRYINGGGPVQKIEKGARLFQLVPLSEKAISKVNIVDTLSETTRGSGGFGSTGT